MKKKILYAFALAFIMLFNVFAGCSFTGTNTTKYYKTVVASVGDIEITKYQLMSAYNNYGYQYANYYSMSTEEAYEKTLNELLDNEILVKYIEENFEELFGESELQAYEISEIWQDVFDYVNEKELLTYVNQIRKDKALDEISTETEEDKTERFIREDYVPTINITRDNNGAILSITQAKTEHNTSLKITENDFEFAYYGAKNKQNDKINQLAQKQLNYYLKEASEDKNLTETQIFSNHLNELFKSYRKSYLTAKFKENYQDNKEITVNSILAKYKELLKIDAQKYADNREAYVKAVQSDASKIYFHPYSDELIYVSHILVKYDKNNTDYNLKNVYKTKLENGEITEAEYNRLMSDNNLGVNCKVYQMVDGVFEDEPTDMNVIELYNTISADINSTRGNDNKLDKFLDYAYTYNQDTGMFSSNDLYTIQLDTEIADTMVSEFADLSRELYNTNGVGSIGICYTQYGAHIIYVAGVVQNKIVNNVDTSTLSGITIDQLENALARLGYNKTMLDVVAELVKNDNYSSYEDMVILQAKNEYKDAGEKIVIYKDNYKDLYE